MNEHHPGGFPMFGRPCGCPPDTLAQDLRREIRNASDRIITILFRSMATALIDDPHLNNGFTRNPFYQHHAEAVPEHFPDQAPPSRPFVFPFRDLESNPPFCDPEPNHYYSYATPRSTRNDNIRANSSPTGSDSTESSPTESDTEYSSTESDSTEDRMSDIDILPPWAGPSTMNMATSEERPDRNYTYESPEQSVVLIYSPAVRRSMCRNGKAGQEDAETSGSDTSNASNYSHRLWEHYSNYRPPDLTREDSLDDHSSWASNRATISESSVASEHEMPIFSSDPPQRASTIVQESTRAQFESGTSHMPPRFDNPEDENIREAAEGSRQRRTIVEGRVPVLVQSPEENRSTRDGLAGHATIPATCTCGCTQISDHVAQRSPTMEYIDLGQTSEGVNANYGSARLRDILRDPAAIRNTQTAGTQNSGLPSHPIVPENENDSTLEKLYIIACEYVDRCKQAVEGNPPTAFRARLVRSLDTISQKLSEQPQDRKFKYMSDIKRECCTLGFKLLIQHLKELERTSLELQIRSTSTSSNFIEYMKLHSKMILPLTEWHLLFQGAFTGITMASRA